MASQDRRILGLATLFAMLVGVASAAGSAGSDVRLVTAVKEQRNADVQHLLKEGADVDAALPDGATALLWAVHWNDLKVVEQLLMAGAKVNAVQDLGVTPLILACENGSEPMVAALLAAGAEPNAVQENGTSPLMLAARGGSLTVVKALLGRGAAIDATIPATGQTALMWATAERHLDVMRELIASGANVRASSKTGFTPFLFATRNGDMDAAKVLIAAGVDINQRGSDGTHPLPLAIVSGRREFADFLLKQGADPNGMMHGVSALHAAVANVDPWLRDWLRARGASIRVRSTVGFDSETRLGLVRQLLEYGADPNARIETSTTFDSRFPTTTAFGYRNAGLGDMKGATPLWVAAYNSRGGGHAEILQLLLDWGADPSIPTADLTTPVMVAAGIGQGTVTPGLSRGPRAPATEAAVRILIAGGADVKAVNEAKFTALHGATFRGLDEVIQLLVEHGADINAQDFQGRTPYRIAERAAQVSGVQSWPETAEFLKTLGADATLGVRYIPPAELEQERLRGEQEDKR
jgi:ankyrin repeat protein